MNKICTKCSNEPSPPQAAGYRRTGAQRPDTSGAHPSSGQAPRNHCAQIEKPLGEFIRQSSVSSGYSTQCKSCQREYNKAYYEKNKEKLRKQGKEWVKKNKDYYNAFARFRSGTNPDFVPKGGKVVRDKEDVRKERVQYRREYVRLNKDKVSLQKKKYNDNLSPEQRMSKNAKKREYLSQNISARIAVNLRNRIKETVQLCYAKRLTSYEFLFGCTVEEFRKWIENHFLPGMTWENWGMGNEQWNLDHHYPCSAFDLTKVEQQKQCFHHTNTYPMWALDNLAKNSKIPDVPRENILIPAFAVSKVESKSN